MPHITEAEIVEGNCIAVVEGNYIADILLPWGASNTAHSFLFFFEARPTGIDTDFSDPNEEKRQ